MHSPPEQPRRPAPPAVRRSPTEFVVGLALALALALPAGAAAQAEPDPAPAPRKIAVVITQAVGVGPLADRLGAIASEIAGEGGAVLLDPAAASARLREAGGRDPLTCGSDASCLGAIADALGVRWVLALGIGRFGGIYGLDLRLLDRDSPAAPATASATWAEPGPDWEIALREALAPLLPAELRAPPRGRLLVRANEPGELFVNGEPAGTLPLERPLELEARSHAIELRSAGGRANANVEVQAGALAEVELTLAPALAEAPMAWVRPARWIVGGATAAFLVGAVATHLSAASLRDDALAQKEAGKPFSGTRTDAFDRLDTSRLLYTGTVAMALGSFSLWLLEGAPPHADLPDEP